MSTKNRVKIAIPGKRLAKALMELELNSETVLNIIDKAHQFHMNESVIASDESAAGLPDTGMRTMPSGPSEDPVYRELKYIIDELEPDQQQMLVALMWIGRGDFGVGEWSEALAHAQDSWTERTAEYVIGTSMAADYLREGLEQFSATAQ